MKRLLIGLVVCCAWVAQAARPPNIIVIFTDDQGYADLGVHDRVEDIRTPYLDDLAKDGVTFTSGYITAPQCSPSRAGLMTGKYQQRFGFDTIPDGPLRLERVTIAERLREAGYVTGMVGKWHLEPNHICVDWATKEHPDLVKDGKVQLTGEIVDKYHPGHQGFDEFFKGEHQRYWANYDLNGENLTDGGEWVQKKGYRLDVQTDAALAFIKRNKDDPFFLYLAYYAPHVPLEATEKYLSRFQGQMPERRRYALAMISAMDDGVGRIRERLQRHGIDGNTLIFYISDNGAPIKIHKEDIPISFRGGAWDGSLNDPLNGEKGTLLEGGIRVPFLVSWPARLPGGTVCGEPVISLDVAATCLAAAGKPIPSELDGVDLVPVLGGKVKPERALYWRFWNQAAMRKGKWKYLALSDGREGLFDLDADIGEQVNLARRHPEKAAALRATLSRWSDGLQPKGLPTADLNAQETGWFAHYLKESE